MLNRKTIQGHFTKLDGPNQIGVSEEEARRLLHGHCRDVDEQILSLKRNPFGKVVGESCLVRYEVHKAPVVAVPDGGPALRGPFVNVIDQAQFMLDLIGDHDPAHYDQLFDQVETQLTNTGTVPDPTLATLMEHLDDLRSDMFFGVQRTNPEDEGLTLGYWPLEVMQ